MRKIVFIGFTLTLLILSIPLANLIQRTNTQYQIEHIESAIQRSLNLCYAQEGFYPGNINYLIENYGLIIDERLYYVSYKIFAANIRPDVTVFRKGSSQ